MTTAQATLTELLDALHDEALDTNDRLDQAMETVGAHPMGHPARAAAERWLMRNDFFGTYR
jgi:hypothetical protein